MTNLFFSLILIFVFCASILAQEISPCPTIIVEADSKMINRLGEVIQFKARVSGNSFKINHQWSINAANIIEGQGTPFIKISTSGMSGDEKEIKATVEITGLPENCNNIASESTVISYIGDPLVIDEYEKISFAKERIRLNKAAGELKQFKDSELAFIFYRTEKDSLKSFNYRQANIRKYLIEILKIPEDRFKFVFGGYSSYKTRIYLMPKSSYLR